VARVPRLDTTVAVAILGASVLNPRWIGPSGPETVLGLAAWLHLVGYATLGATLRPRFSPGWCGAAVAVVLVTGYGAGIECLQSFLTYRTASVLDAAINGFGASLGVAFWHGIERWRARGQAES